MPNTKKCEKCGWEYHITYPEPSCRFCGTRFKYGFCVRCGGYKHLRYGRYCTTCNSIRVMEQTRPDLKNANWYKWNDKRLVVLERAFTEWLNMISKVPKPLKTLTDEEWIAACLHFGKCAVCDNESIDARAFFVAFAFGGRYAAWNVIPVCEKCALEFRQNQNPFIRYNSRLHYDLKRGLGTTNLNGIVDYLKPILEQVIEKR